MGSCEDVETNSRCGDETLVDCERAPIYFCVTGQVITNVRRHLRALAYQLSLTCPRAPQEGLSSCSCASVIVFQDEIASTILNYSTRLENSQSSLKLHWL